MSDKFASEHLKKFGWQKGKGLGLHNDGITKPISLAFKNDNNGIGVKKDDWNFAWW